MLLKQSAPAVRLKLKNGFAGRLRKKKPSGGRLQRKPTRKAKRLRGAGSGLRRKKLHG